MREVQEEQALADNADAAVETPPQGGEETTSADQSPDEINKASNSHPRSRHFRELAPGGDRLLGGDPTIREEALQEIRRHVGDQAAHNNVFHAASRMHSPTER
jgi:hypothetical protein